MTLVSGWRLALRLAWRDAWRAKGRSVLVLVMVTFPVVAVIAADVAQATSSVSSVESLDRRIGAAEAKVTVLPHVNAAYQRPDPDDAFGAVGGDRPTKSLTTVEEILGGRAPPSRSGTGKPSCARAPACSASMRPVWTCRVLWRADSSDWTPGASREPRTRWPSTGHSPTRASTSETGSR